MSTFLASFPRFLAQTFFSFASAYYGIVMMESVRVCKTAITFDWLGATLLGGVLLTAGYESIVQKLLHKGQRENDSAN